MERSKYIKVIEGEEMTQSNTSYLRSQKYLLSPRGRDGS